MSAAIKGEGNKNPGRRRVRPAFGAKTQASAEARSAPGFMTYFVGKSGHVDIDRVTGRLRLTKTQLAETVGLATATITKSDRQQAPRTQSRVREMLEIIARVQNWAGGETQALAWYRSQPIPALDGRTAEALVKSGEAGAVRDYLDHIALGGFA